MSRQTIVILAVAAALVVAGVVGAIVASGGDGDGQGMVTMPNGQVMSEEQMQQMQGAGGGQTTMPNGQGMSQEEMGQMGDGN